MKQTRQRLKGTGGVDENIILGILGCMIAVYTIVSCLSIYSISTRKNEMENCISQVLKYHLNRYYATGVSDTEVEAFVRQEIRQQLHTASRVSIDVKAVIWFRVLFR